MKIHIFQIKINDGRREADPEAVHELADSISKVGLLNPITVDQEYTLIAGLHRLEAAKLLGWAEIECSVNDLDGLLAELAEIDENLIRRKLDCIAQGEQLNRRKEIYEALHPQTKAGISQAVGMNRSIGNNVGEIISPTSKSFTSDTAEKLGVTPRTIEQKIQIAKKIAPDAKQVIRDKKIKIGTVDALKLSRLAPEQQEEAVSQLAAGAIQSVDEYCPVPAEPEPAEKQAPEILPELAPPPEAPEPPAATSAPETGYYPTIKDSVADLKNPDKDRRQTPDSYLVTLSYFLQRFCQSMESYTGPEYDTVWTDLTQAYLDQIQQKIQLVHNALDEMYNQIERKVNNEGT